jgi:hypothetical protein
MALTITSFAPAGGPTSGGMSVVITGTGLLAVTAVMFGDVEGAIDTGAVNTATSLTVIAPAIPNADAGAVKITLLDSVTPTEVQSAGSFTYATVATPAQTTNLAKKWAWEVSDDDGATWVPVRGRTNLQPAVEQTTQDDSDSDSDEWGSDVVTQLKWSLVASVDRKTTSGYTEDPGQRIVRLASAQVGPGSVIKNRWYDKNGGDEAYTGYGIPKWSEKGGGTADKSSVDITVMGRGARTTITNPNA